MNQEVMFPGFEKPNTKAKLESRFIIPPFSVFDTRQGYWQDRKRLWIELGIKSEVGREQLTNTSLKIDHNDPKYAYAANRGNSEGGSIFDPVLCELLYKWFCPINGTILDPFSGGSVRGIVASILGYKYYGIDLAEEQIKANQEQASIIVPGNIPNWYCGNSMFVNSLIPEPGQFDFIFSCPPYFDLEQYSDDTNDLSNMSWNNFRESYRLIINRCLMRLKNNRFACFVISEIRDNKGNYRGFVPYTIAVFENAGAHFYNEIILVNNVGSLPVRIGHMFGNYRKIGRVHQNVLVFYKGNIDEIPNNFNHIETDIMRTLDNQSI